ncbi:Oxygen-insensitive NAD(P)H nitroreductase [Chromobacterium violaceum]|uniref:Oxygen-insensitive NAD(P)H nitroreductase n=1 Tax=Chromobacterium violaceum TaxID=536 RepID=A0A447TCR8_CHRVL|nr:Oxygen-insensitive NAD(P)H nitroreductase [Chromobacterium violaceum]
MNIAHYAQTRYTTKAFDPGFRLSAGQIEQIETLLRHSPSSTNSQPWHFFIAGSDEGKARVAKATADGYAFNQAKVLHASHVVVFCTRAALDDAYLRTLLDQEERDGRFASPEARAGQHKGRSYFADMHRFELRDARTGWKNRFIWRWAPCSWRGGAGNRRLPDRRLRPADSGRGAGLAGEGADRFGDRRPGPPLRRRLQRQAAEVPPAGRGRHHPSVTQNRAARRARSPR